MPNADANIIKLPERLTALRELLLLDTKPEEAFDRLTRLAAAITRSPIALVSLVEGDRQFFKSSCGLGEPWASEQESPLTHSFCQHVVASAQPLIIEDARFHPLVENNLAIRDMNVIGYLGIPLTLKSGHTIGSFCVIDDKPRHWTEMDIHVVKELAASTMTEIELRIEVDRRIRAEPLVNIIEATTDLIWLVDMDNRVRAFNKAARQFFNIKTGRHERPRLDTFLRGETYEFLRNEALRVAAQKGSWSGDLYFTRHDGQQVPVSVILLLHRDENGKPDYWSATARDITVLRESEQALQHALESEKRVTSLQGRFINTISHEFRNPLSGVLSSLELLIRHGSRTDPAAHYERMKKSVRDISSILDQGIELLDDAGDENPPEIENIALEPFAREVAGVAAHTNNRIIDVEAPKDTAVLIDAPAMRLIAGHLLSNALKYSTTGTVVSLKIAVRDCDENGNCQLVMYVSDRGIGIPDDDQPFIFERFYRAYNQPNVPGLGAGLYHVKRLVERMAGRIEFFSREGEGTEFVIIVPVMLTAGQPQPIGSLARSSRQQSPSA